MNPPRPSPPSDTAPRTPNTALTPHIRKVRETIAKSRELRAESRRLLAAVKTRK